MNKTSKAKLLPQGLCPDCLEEKPRHLLTCALLKEDVSNLEYHYDKERSLNYVIEEDYDGLWWANLNSAIDKLK